MTTFTKILVSLDGAPFSEQALELVDALRGQGQPECRLLRVVSSDDESDPESKLEEARAYLEQIGASRLGGAAEVLAKRADDPRRADPDRGGRPRPGRAHDPRTGRPQALDHGQRR